MTQILLSVRYPQPRCIKCWILEVQWLPGLFLMNMMQRLLTLALNGTSI